MKKRYILPMTLSCAALIAVPVCADMNQDIALIEAQMGIDHSEMKMVERVAELEDQLGITPNEGSNMVDRIEVLMREVGLGSSTGETLNNSTEDNLSNSTEDNQSNSTDDNLSNSSDETDNSGGNILSRIFPDNNPFSSGNLLEREDPFAQDEDGSNAGDTELEADEAAGKNPANDFTADSVQMEKEPLADGMIRTSFGDISISDGPAVEKAGPYSTSYYKEFTVDPMDNYAILYKTDTFGMASVRDGNTRITSWEETDPSVQLLAIEKLLPADALSITMGSPIYDKTEYESLEESAIQYRQSVSVSGAERGILFYAIYSGDQFDKTGRCLFGYGNDEISSYYSGLPLNAEGDYSASVYGVLKFDPEMDLSEFSVGEYTYEVTEWYDNEYECDGKVTILGDSDTSGILSLNVIVGNGVGNQRIVYMYNGKAYCSTYDYDISKSFVPNYSFEVLDFYPLTDMLDLTYSCSDAIPYDYTLSEIMSDFYLSYTECTLSEDGKVLTIDTNPHDYEYGDYEYVRDSIKAINVALGFDEDLYTRMDNTSSADGEKVESNDKVIVTWSYDKQTGLLVKYYKP